MWMEKSLAHAYSEAAYSYGTAAFRREELARSLGKSLNYTDQIVHRLRGKLVLERVGWGKYRVVEPGKWIGIASTAEAVPQMERVISDIFSLISTEKIDSLVLYGSVARGESTRESDIDLILVTDMGDRADIEKRLERLPEKVNVLVVSKEGVRALASEDPLFLVFSEAEAKVLFDVDRDYRDAVSEAVWNLAGKPSRKVLGRYLKLVQGFLQTAHRLIKEKRNPQLAAYFLVFSARTLLMVEQVLNDRADHYAVSSGLKRIFGKSYNQLYRAYRSERENKAGARLKIGIVRRQFTELDRLLKDVELGVKRIEKKKAAPKGHKKP